MFLHVGNHMPMAVNTPCESYTRAFVRMQITKLGAFVRHDLNKWNRRLIVIPR